MYLAQAGFRVGHVLEHAHREHRVEAGILVRECVDGIGGQLELDAGVAPGVAPVARIAVRVILERG